MTAPTTKTDFDVSGRMYGNADDGRLPANPAGLDPIYGANGRFDSGLDTLTGFHGAAFVTQGPDPTVIVGVEGTDAAGIAERKAFLLARIPADTDPLVRYLSRGTDEGRRPRSDGPLG